MSLKNECNKNEWTFPYMFTYFKYVYLIALLFLFQSCNSPTKAEKVIKTPPKSKAEAPKITISNIEIVNQQIVITGTNLDTVNDFNIKESGNSANFKIETKTKTSIVANALSDITFVAGKAFDFILETAEATATYTINFSLCDSKLGSKGFNCSITPNDKEVLSYDAVSGKWKPRAINGLSYQGAWDASMPLPSTSSAGDYYIVSVASGEYSVGDWIVFNGTEFDQIDNSTAILSVFGRTGEITAEEGDYILTKMGDVDLLGTPPVAGDVLKFNGTKWISGTPNAGTVTQVSGTAPITVTTGTSTPTISIQQASSTASGYLSSTDWNTFNNKQAAIVAGTTSQYYRGDKTFQTLDTSIVTENTNLYFTNARALGVSLTGFNNALTGQIAATDTILQAFGRAQNQINVLTNSGSDYLLKSGIDTLSGDVSLTGTITASGSGDIIVNSVPLTMTSAVNKTYADGKLDMVTGGLVSGVVTLDNNLKIKNAGTGTYITISGGSGTGDYTLSLPPNAGTSGYVLQTNGAGILSWINPSLVNTGTDTVTSASIVNGTIVDADINASAAIAQSKIANLTTDLGNKVSTTLTSGKILMGNASNIATAVTPSGDATISNAGAITLKNTGTAGTYTSVTTDAQGRVTAGSSPAIVSSITATAPVTIGGTASAPIVAMASSSTGTDGYLASTDWNTFNNKQAAITAASALNSGSVTTNLQDGIILNPYGAATGNTGEIHFNELLGSNYVAFKSPDVLAANIIYTLPTADGSSGQVLTTNASGILSWTTPPTVPVSSVFGRTGAVVATAGDYTATQITNTAAGTIAATTVQAALNELDSEKQPSDATLTSLAAYNTNGILIQTAADTFTGRSIASTANRISVTNGDGISGNPTIDIDTTFLPSPIAEDTGKLLKASGANASTWTALGSSDITTALGFTPINKAGDSISSGTFTLSGSAILRSPDPISGTDVANKQYVDGYGQWAKGENSSINYAAGNVGIGNTAPAQLLHVGSATTTAASAVANFQTATGTCTITPASSGSGIACSSDERLKKNIREVSGNFALEHILNLQAVTYEFKKDPEERRHTGFIAQKVKKFASEFVRLNEDGYYQIYYDGFIPWITEAIKELYHKWFNDSALIHRDIASIKVETSDRMAKLEEENMKLKKENFHLKKDNDEIKERLNKIEKYLSR